MRLFDDRAGRIYLPLILAAALGACSTGYDAWSDGELASAPPAPAAPASLPAAPGTRSGPALNGPAADYPVVVGDPYTVQGKTFSPEDTLNYDEVGYAVLDAKGGSTISGEHHTLPLPSYVEVTSLDSGRTILVRLERRGPMVSTNVIGLSPGAFKQLGASPGTPVRVRRVNPPEQERAMLRSGGQAPARIDTPMSLVNVLRRKLPNGEGPVSIAAKSSAPMTAAPVPQSTAPGSPPALPPLDNSTSASDSMQPEVATVAQPGEQNFPWVTAKPPAQPQSAPAPQTPPAHPPAYHPPQPASPVAAPSEGYVVQAGAFSSRQNALAVARAIGGSISYSGTLYRVRTDPFTSLGEAEGSLAKVHAAGYSDARIFWGG